LLNSEENPLIQLIYFSSATRELSDSELEELLEQARSRNAKQNVTGMLIYAEGTFMQVLEGSRSDVHDIYSSILRDPRNKDNIELTEMVISERNFSDWSMFFQKISPRELSEVLSPSKGSKFQDESVVNRLAMFI
jgi:hypothetical protein